MIMGKRAGTGVGHGQGQRNWTEGEMFKAE